MSDHTTDKLLAEFEAWVKSLSPEKNFPLERKANGDYVFWFATAAWLAWQEQDRRFSERLKPLREAVERLDKVNSWAAIDAAYSNLAGVAEELLNESRGK